MTVALYARVSTAKQAEKGLSIPDQLRQLRDWSTANGYIVGEEYIEPGDDCGCRHGVSCYVRGRSRLAQALAVTEAQFSVRLSWRSGTAPRRRLRIVFHTDCSAQLRSFQVSVIALPSRAA